MNRLETAKKVIQDNIHAAEYGIYNTRNLACDPMTTIYNEDELQIDICYKYHYFEVFGLTEEEFRELSVFYYSITV